MIHWPHYKHFGADRPGEGIGEGEGKGRGGGIINFILGKGWVMVVVEVALPYPILPCLALILFACISSTSCPLLLLALHPLRPFLTLLPLPLTCLLILLIPLALLPLPLS